MSTKHIYFIYVLILLHEKCSFNICIMSAIHKVKFIFQIFEKVMFLMPYLSFKTGFWTTIYSFCLPFYLHFGNKLR